MKISENGLALVKHFEGCNLTAAPDSGGVLTIGWGHTNAEKGLRVTPGLTITQQQADDQLAMDMEHAENDVMKLVIGSLTQAQFDALVSFQFNTGGLILESGQRSTLLARLNGGDPWEAAGQFDLWNHDNGKIVPGLTRRRHAERDLFCGFGWERWKR